MLLSETGSQFEIVEINDGWQTHKCRPPAATTTEQPALHNRSDLKRLKRRKIFFRCHLPPHHAPRPPFFFPAAAARLLPPQLLPPLTPLQQMLHWQPPGQAAMRRGLPQVSQHVTRCVPSRAHCLGVRGTWRWGGARKHGGCDSNGGQQDEMERMWGT